MPLQSHGGWLRDNLYTDIQIDREGAFETPSLSSLPPWLNRIMVEAVDCRGAVGGMWYGEQDR